MISVKVLADSINPAGVRITSWLLTYPRYIHSELLTHRVFSRNSASSRAIPFKKLVELVKSNAAKPAKWGREQKGMQSGDVVESVGYCLASWLNARDACIREAEQMASGGLHKSICNRVIEPWMHITAIFTATDHRNFFSLRAHPDAEPTFQVLAYRMLDKYLHNPPKSLQWGEWHIPQFAKGAYEAPEINDERWQYLLKIATAHCARLSYLTFDGDHSPEKDIELHDRLLTSGHMSPFEHCAQAVESSCYTLSNFDQIGIWRQETAEGFHFITQVKESHWLQYRKNFENENRINVDLDQVLASKPDWITL